MPATVHIGEIGQRVLRATKFEQTVFYKQQIKEPQVQWTKEQNKYQELNIE